MKKSLEKSKNVLEEKRKKGQAKNLHKKDQHAHNNCYELRSRAIKNQQSVRVTFIPLPVEINVLKTLNPTTTSIYNTIYNNIIVYNTHPYNAYSKFQDNN